MRYVALIALLAATQLPAQTLWPWKTSLAIEGGVSIPLPSDFRDDQNLRLGPAMGLRGSWYPVDNLLLGLSVEYHQMTERRWEGSVQWRTTMVPAIAEVGATAPFGIFRPWLSLGVGATWLQSENSNGVQPYYPDILPMIRGTAGIGMSWEDGIAVVASIGYNRLIGSDYPSAEWWTPKIGLAFRLHGPIRR